MRSLFLLQLQQGQMDCGPTCLYMISRYYGRVLIFKHLG
ncbi:cysteine peptidase family C39 domain-containing protein [Sediminibacterium sp.]